MQIRQVRPNAVVTAVTLVPLGYIAGIVAMKTIY